MSQEATEIVRLGAGSFATIYVWQSRNGLAIKCAADPRRYPELLQEFESHRKIHTAAKDGTLFVVPKPVRYYSDFHGKLGLDPSSWPEGPCVYTMQRVWPIPPALAASIRANFFPPSHDGYTKPFIARIYLGRSAERSAQLRRSRFFNANNFPLDAARCEQLKLPVALVAENMGKLLAKIHYDSELDGRDIEFVLGGDELNCLAEYGFFCFDFNQCNPHDNKVENLVSSFFDNDPYYPRPGMRYWDEFKQGYVIEASLKSDEALKLGETFVDKVEVAVAAKTAAQPPEGRGNEMALLEEETAPSL